LSSDWEIRLDSEHMFTYTGGMITHEKETQLLPGIQSKDAFFKLVDPAVFERDTRFSLISLLPSEMLPMFGTSEAGFPILAEESLADNISLDDLPIQNRAASFLVKVSGDSMTGAGIPTACRATW